MLALRRKGSTLSVETMGGIVTWDAACGGQISGFVVKDELSSHSLLPKKGVLPDLRFIVDGRPVLLSGATAAVKVTQREAGFVKIMTTASLARGALNVVQEYEVHEEGALFCNLAIETPGGKRFDLSDASLNLAIDTASTRKARWGCFTREPKYKRDYSTVHAFVGFKMFRELSDKADARELYPYLSLDLGWEATRFFSSHVEFLLEDWTEYKDGPLSDTRTRVGMEDGVWQAHWHFHAGKALRVVGPCRYRNRWGIMFGRARTQSGAEADPAVRNNLLGSRICHCMYPYARQADTWPWVSMPIKQVAVQKPQLFQGNPELARVDEAKRLGADTMIVHQFWMRNPGSNNEPIADYVPSDPKWLRAFTARAHRKGMRVLYYVRGTEMWQQFTTYFEDFLEKDRDGLYADWNTPFCMGYVKCSPLHVSAHNYFHFTKAQRRRVGAGGVLLGHTGNANLLASACYDVAIGGEFSVQHDQLLSHPESSAYYAYVNCMGAHLISGNLPDRIAFSSPKAAAICAALGMTSHPFMEPGVTFDERVAFIKPLWDAMGRLPGKVVRLHNPAYIPTRAVTTGAETLYPSLWQSDAGKALLLVTNMGERAAAGAVELDLRELDVPARAKVVPVAVPGTFGGARVDGTTVTVKGMPSLAYTALLIG